MSLAVLGMLITDATFISTAKYSRFLPGGMWFLIVGPLVDGCLGSKSSFVLLVQSVIPDVGYSTVMAAVHAYIADTSEPAAR